MTSPFLITAGFSTLSFSNLKLACRRSTPSFLTFTIDNAFFKFSVVKASDNAFHYTFCFIWPAYTYRNRARLPCRVVVPAGKYRVANKYHLADLYPEYVTQFV